MKHYRRSEQISMLHLPSHGDTIKEIDGTWWELRLSGGFRLCVPGDVTKPHPSFLGGPMEAEEFAWWFNSEFEPCRARKHLPD